MRRRHVHEELQMLEPGHTNKHCKVAYLSSYKTVDTVLVPDQPLKHGRDEPPALAHCPATRVGARIVLRMNPQSVELVGMGNVVPAKQASTHDAASNTYSRNVVAGDLAMAESDLAEFTSTTDHTASLPRLYLTQLIRQLISCQPGLSYG
jgi:hypothetical protein